jgi:hypothetical protein
MRARTQRAERSRDGTAIELDEAYLRAVERLEELPENRSGADKSWVEQALRSWRQHYARAVRVR